MTPESQFQPRGRVVLRRIGVDLLLVPVNGPAAGGRVYPINETARLIWEGLAAGETVKRTAQRLSAQYPVAETEALADCLACARSFLDESLLEAKTP